VNNPPDLEIRNALGRGLIPSEMAACIDPDEDYALIERYGYWLQQQLTLLLGHIYSKRWPSMQAVQRDTDCTNIPRVYRNRPYSPAFNSPQAEQLCDVIYVIDDAAVHEISACFSALGIKVIAFASAAEYLEFNCRDTAACLVLNTHLPDMSGFELQRRLAEKGNPSVIFISDHCDITSTVRAMKAGAIEFLTKPVDLQALVTAVQVAFTQDRKLRRRKAELADLNERFSLLTPREREVLPLVVGGLLNKQAAAVLGISEVTLQIHRSQVMRKTQAESLPELVRMTMKLRIPYWRESQSSYQPKLTLLGLQGGFKTLAESVMR
jgi:FixJ family two-component response regulator